MIWVKLVQHIPTYALDKCLNNSPILYLIFSQIDWEIRKSLLSLSLGSTDRQIVKAPHFKIYLCL